MKALVDENLPHDFRRLILGTLHRWMESRGKLGAQHKCPGCANHRDIVEGVVEVTDRVIGRRSDEEVGV